MGDTILAGVIMAIVLGVSLGVAWLVGGVSCSSKAEKMELPYDYGLIQGCMVKAPRGWIPIEGVRDID